MKNISVILIVFLLISSTGAFLGSSSAVDQNELSEKEQVDVPTWQIGSTWTYHQHFWTNDTEDDWMYLEERLTFTVDRIEHMEIDGVMTPVYNVTLDGDILGGEGGDGAAPVPLIIEDGFTEGYILYRMDDHGVIEDSQYKYIDGRMDGMGDPEVTTTVDAIETVDPVVESYDFPIGGGDVFWANNTVDSERYEKVEIGDNVIDEDTIDESKDVEREVHISDEMVPKEVPAGSFETFEVVEELSGDEVGTQTRYYDEDVQNYVKEDLDLSEADWIRTLEDHDLPQDPNTMSLDPDRAYVGETVTLNGEFPDHPDEKVEVKIPMADLQISTETDPTGEFSVDIDVPRVEDNTPSPDNIGSVGIVALIEDTEETYQVSTLSILEPEGPYKPSNPQPSNGSEAVSTEAQLEVDVEHVDGSSMDVTFYDASDESVIDTDNDVASGTTASAEWNDLDHDTTYRWYAEADDGAESMGSDIWSFTTKDADIVYNDLLIQIEGEGSTEPEEGTHTYEEGEVVTIEAIPEEGWYFQEWSGDIGGTDEEITVTIDEDKEITANFAIHEYDLDISIEGSGEINVDPEKERYEHGDEVTVTAGPEDDWIFVEWTGDRTGTEEEITITMDRDMSLTAHFEESKELTIAVEGEGTTYPAEGSHRFGEGEETTVNAVPAEGWRFTRWTGDHQGEEEEITITMDEDKEITARFEEEVDHYELTVNVEGEGSTDPEEGTHTYEENEEVVLTAIPDKGWYFIEWTGDHTGTEEEITVTMDEDKEITAHFEFGGPDHIKIGPSYETITAGETITYTASTYDKTGDLLEEVTDRVEWTIEDEAGGRQASNLYRSENAGAWTVTAEYSHDGETLGDETLLMVEPAEPDRIEIESGMENVIEGFKVSYIATAYDRFGNEIGDVTDETEWTVDSEAEGRWDDNLYVSEKPGSWTITGTYQGISETETLVVESDGTEDERGIISSYRLLILPAVIAGIVVLLLVIKIKGDDEQDRYQDPPPRSGA